MLQSIQPDPHLAALRNKAPWSTPAHRLTQWLLGYWQAQCRRAERPRRIVPRY